MGKRGGQNWKRSFKLLKKVEDRDIAKIVAEAAKVEIVRVVRYNQEGVCNTKIQYVEEREKAKEERRKFKREIELEMWNFETLTIGCERIEEEMKKKKEAELRKKEEEMKKKKEEELRKK
jgi:glycogen debranching enzyme